MLFIIIIHKLLCNICASFGMFLLEMHNIQRKARENARRILIENHNLKLELESKKKEIEQRCKELNKYEAKNDGEKRNIDIEKEKVIYVTM